MPRSKRQRERVSFDLSGVGSDWTVERLYAAAEALLERSYLAQASPAGCLTLRVKGHHSHIARTADATVVQAGVRRTGTELAIDALGGDLVKIKAKDAESDDLRRAIENSLHVDAAPPPRFAPGLPSAVCAPAAAAVAERHGAFESSRLAGGSVRGAPTQQSAEIQCPQCTFLNPPTAKKCEICDGKLK